MIRSHLSIAALSLTLLAPALLASVPAPVPVQNEQLHTASQQELDVIKVILKQEAAWNRGDLETFARSYKDSPETLFISRQVNHGFAGLLEEYRHEYPNKAAMGTLGFSELEVHSLDDKFAVCIGKYHLDRGKKEGGPAEGLFSLVLEKTDEGWKIIVDHTT
jgi:uncharacterized protein (TIGR02246 family)